MANKIKYNGTLRQVNCFIPYKWESDLEKKIASVPGSRSEWIRLVLNDVLKNKIKFTPVYCSSEFQVATPLPEEMIEDLQHISDISKVLVFAIDYIIKTKNIKNLL